MNRRNFLRAAGVSVAGLAAYAHWLEPFWLEVTRRDLAIHGLPQSLEGRTLLHLSDLHIGPLVDDDYLTRVWRTAGALAPDIVTYTGDWVTWHGEGQFAKLERHLAQAPRGRMLTLSVLGNHDYGDFWRQPHVADGITDRVTQAGIRVLRNATLDVDGLFVAGIDDMWARRANPEKALASWRPGTPSLVLNHNPDVLDWGVAWRRYDGWVLSGHTHGGQCRSPFLPPPMLPVVNKRYTSGEIPLPDGRRVYISRGVGFTAQARFCVRPEITLFTLRRA